MNHLTDILYNFLNTAFLLYTFVLFASYIILALISAFVLRFYLKKNSFVNYNVIRDSPLAPSVSIIAPAHNESKTILENIRALLQIRYNDFDVIVVNDGSTDDTMEKVIGEFSLQKVSVAYHKYIPVKHIRGIYRSDDIRYSCLVVIDKDNGGKFDALNAGINFTDKTNFVVIDVDCVLEKNALLRLVKPFIEESERTVIAAGGVIRIANSCTVDNGRITQVKVPGNLWARFQVLEYTRAFLMGRIAWAQLNGLLVISGAFGMFNRDIVIRCGGYADTVGEDMELIVRMRRYMCEHNLPYKVHYIPDPLCWTEVPSTLPVLGRQRNRWTRGNMETLFKHIKLFMNPKYGLIGMLSYPYWLLFEWLAPVVEVFGIVYFIILLFAGSIDWNFFLLMLGFVYSFAMAFSTWALLFEELTYHKYPRKTDILKLFVTAHLEPLIYHPLQVYFAVRGNIDYFRGKRGWGNMQRVGFGGKNVTI